MKNSSWAIALRVLVNVSGWILAPLIVGLLLGKWLDRKYGTEPWLFLTTIGVCFLISMYGLIINAVKEFKKIEKESRKEERSTAGDNSGKRDEKNDKA